MLEAVIRVRASRGLRMSSFHGNFFVRSTDLLAMPAVPQDQGYVMEVQIEETITSPFVVFQTAVLHTTCYGERRIRVVTSAVPTTTSLSEVFASADQIALATYFANKAVEKSLTHKLEDSRDALYSRMVEILTAYKSSMTAAGSGASAQLALCENMKMLPVLVLGLVKNVRSFYFDPVKVWRLTPVLFFGVGRNQAERTNTSRPQGLCSGVVDHPPFPVLDPLSLPIFLLSS